MASFGGFWSYAHDDDEADFGRIADLGRDLAAQYRSLTGTAIDLFLDRDSIEWGNEWRRRVDESLSGVAFFVPVLSPTYFQRPECRRELRYFAERATSLGLTELLMPVLWVDFAALREEKPEDELITLVRQFQWVEWTELKFSERPSGDYRRAVWEMAERLARANADAEVSGPPELAAAADGGGDAVPDEEMGLADSIAAAEVAMPAWAETSEQIGQLVSDLGEIMVTGTQLLQASDEAGRGFVGRVNVYREIARQLAEPAEESVQFGNRFVAQLSEVDAGYRAILETVSSGVPESDVAEVEDFYETVRGMASEFGSAMDQLENLLAQFVPIERQSRDLRAPLKRFRTGLSLLVEARSVANDWIKLLDDHPIRVVADPPDESEPGVEIDVNS